MAVFPPCFSEICSPLTNGWRGSISDSGGKPDAKRWGFQRRNPAKPSFLSFQIADKANK